MSDEPWEVELPELLGRLDRKERYALWADFKRKLDGRRCSEIMAADRCQRCLRFTPPPPHRTFSNRFCNWPPVGPYCQWPHTDARWGPRALPSVKGISQATRILRRAEARLAAGVLYGVWPEMVKKHRLGKKAARPALDTTDEETSDCA